jgi:hypothetical protein
LYVGYTELRLFSLRLLFLVYELDFFLTQDHILAEFNGNKASISNLFDIDVRNWAFEVPLD